MSSPIIRRVLLSLRHLRFTRGNVTDHVQVVSSFNRLPDHVMQTSYRFSSNLIKSKTGSADLLHEQLANTSSFENVLEIVSSHHTVMNNKHIVIAFNELQKYNEAFSADILLDNANFELLCEQTYRRGRYFNVDETIQVLKSFIYLPISPSSRLVQTFLQMLRKNINDVSFSKIPFVGYVIDKLIEKEATPLAEALKVALPIVMQLNIDGQLEEAPLKSVIGCLRYAVYNNVSRNRIQKMINMVSERKDSITDHVDALRIFGTISKISLNKNEYPELSAFVLDIVTRGIDEVSAFHTISTLKSCMRHNIIHSKFLDAIALKMVVEKWEMWQVSTVLSIFNTMKYINVECIEGIARLIVESKDDLNEDKRVSIYNIVEYFSLANCVPTKAEQVFRILNQCAKKMQELLENAPFMLIAYLANNVSLQIYPTGIIRMVMHQNFYNAVRIDTSTPEMLSTFYRHMLLIDQSLVVNKYWENSCLSTKFVKDAAVHLMTRKPSGSQLEKAMMFALQDGLGGQQFVLSDLWTKGGIYIDNLIVLRGGKYPLSLHNLKIKNESDQFEETRPEHEINQRQMYIAPADITAERNVEHLSTPPKNKEEAVRFVEDLPLPMDVKQVVVMPIPESCYACNLPRVPSHISCRIRNLEKLSYSVVAVHLSQWEKLAESEKVPYLMREIHGPVTTSESNFSATY